MILNIITFAVSALAMINANRLQDFISSDYNPYEIPPEQTNVWLGFYINSLEFKDNDVVLVDMYFRQSWLDSRLKNPAFGRKYVVHPNIRDQIWLPDIYFRNARAAENKFVPMPQFFLSINSTGQVWFTQTIIAEFTKPPGDSFPIWIESYTHTTDELSLSWLINPVDINQVFNAAGRSVSKTDLIDCTMTYSSGTYPCLRVDINFE